MGRGDLKEIEVQSLILRKYICNRISYGLVDVQGFRKRNITSNLIYLNTDDLGNELYQITQLTNLACDSILSITNSNFDLGNQACFTQYYDSFSELDSYGKIQRGRSFYQN